MAGQIGALFKEVSTSTTEYASVVEVPDGSLSVANGIATIDMSGGSGHGVGSVTQHSDINSAGSGDIITVNERIKISNITITAATNLDTIRNLLTTFNGSNQLVLLNGTGQLPTLDGANLTGLVKPSDVGVVFLSPTGDASGLTNIPEDTSKADKGANSDITSLSGLTTALSTSQGGTGTTSSANTANGIVVLNGLGELPVLDGSNLTGLSKNPQRVHNVINSTTVVVSDFDENTIFTTDNANIDVVFTLPPANDVIGKSVRFVKTQDLRKIQILASGTDTIGTSVPGGTFTEDSTESPADCTVTSIGGGRYLVRADGVWLTDLNQFSGT